MTVHVAICKENDIYAAQCLEHDVCAQGKTREDALRVFRITLMGQIALEKRAGKEPPLKDFPPAPLFYWRNFKNIERVSVDESKIQVVESSSAR